MIKNKAKTVWGYKPKQHYSLKEWLIHISGVLKVHGIAKTHGYLDSYVKMEIV